MWENYWFPILQRTRNHPFLGYVISIAAPMIAALIGEFLREVLDTEFAFIMFYPAICVATLFGRAHGGLISTILGAAFAWFFFISPIDTHGLSWPHSSALDVFVIISFMLVGIIELLNGAVDQLSLYERRMRAAFSAANMGAWQINFLTGQIHWTPELEKIFGRTHEKSQSAIAEFLTYVYPEDRNRYLATMTEQLGAMQQTHYENEFRIVRGDGRLRWILLRGEIIRGRDKRVHSIVGVASNITERRDADERFLRVIESDPNGIVVVNETGSITMVNARTEELFGYSREELIGNPVEMLVPARVREGHAFLRENFFAKFERRPMGTNRVLYAQRKDGSEFPAEIGLNPIPGTGECLMLAIILDITERHGQTDTVVSQ